MKSSAAPLNTSPTKALIFIPDISGFTQFVTETEISHSQHIIQELLNLIIDSNKLDLKISEVEGDAILFYRFGNAPTAKELLEQVKHTFILFHHHLKKYESHRICNCGACRSAHNLTIKFVAHYGDITINQVQQFNKLFGKDVIVAHRLLKNDIPNHEYALFTQHLTDCCPDWSNDNLGVWSERFTSAQDYDSGNVSFSYVPMEDLRKQLPPVDIVDYGITRKKSKLLETAVDIDAPFELVCDVILDVPFRTQWIPGTIPVEQMNSEIAQEGQTHKCLANGPLLIGHDFHMQSDQISFTETPVEKTHSTIYDVKRIAEKKTRVTATGIMPKNFIKLTLFQLMMKKKIVGMYEQALVNLKQYCEDLVAQGKSHGYHIEINTTENEMIS